MLADAPSGSAALVLRTTETQYRGIKLSGGSQHRLLCGHRKLHHIQTVG
ncbi:hypothetical protein E2C01_091452 [Portunus trituberculatus]|uniref:Uncharacterized protein n=1 Tax=Portunus trituberculatus TaxID=210409 RepID=A0A5B7JSZ2_PORTR|nr:hypothetical protein [Portunus trituberculatus]